MEQLALEDCRIDLRTRRVVRGDDVVALTDKETALLVYLAARPGVAVSREELLREVWEYDASVLSRTVDTAMRRLRRKVERDPARPAHLHTEHGVGYRFEPLRSRTGEVAAPGPDPVLGLAVSTSPDWVRDELGRNGGYAVRTELDEVLAAFASGRGAMRWAEAVLRLPGARVALWRGGALPTHDPSTRRVSYAGPGVEALRTLLGRVRPEQGLVHASIVAEAAGDAGPSGAPAAPLGEQAVMVIGALPAASAGATNLSPEPDGFFGRAEAIARLDAAMGQHRLVTVTGLGGIGKTRLAVHVGWQQVRSGGSVWLADLSPARDLAGVVQQVGAALEIPISATDPVSDLGAALAARGDATLLLDNAEQVLEPVTRAARAWLDAAPALRVLVTSRHALGLDDERVVAVGPLEPAAGATLFRARALAAAPDRPIDDPESLRELLARLDHHPLAIELAAARHRLVSVRDMVVRLGRGADLRLLAGGPQGRHSAVRTCLEWSWELLAPWERVAFAQLSVFEASFPVAAAEAVLDLTDWPDAPWPLDVIDTLVRASLVAREGATEPRLRMYAIPRRFAAAHLGRASAVEARHGRWFARLGCDEALAADTGEALRARQRRIALPDLLAAARRSTVAEVDRVACAVAACAALTRDGPIDQATTLLDGFGDVADADAAARLALARGQVLRVAGALDDAIGVLAEAASTARPRREGPLRAALGLVLREAGRPTEARSALERAIALQDATGPVPVAVAQLQLAAIEEEEGAVEAAAGRLAELIGVLREAGNGSDRAIALNNLGLLRERQGRTDEATSLYEAALELHRASGNLRSEGVTRSNLGNALMAVANLDRAEAEHARSLRIARQVGSRIGEGVARTNLGNVARVRGDGEGAVEHYRAALAIHEAVGSRRSAAVAGLNIAGILRETGRLDEARAGAEAALAAALDLDNAFVIAHARLELGTIHAARGDADASEAVLREVLSTVEEARMPDVVGRAWAGLARLALEAGAVDPARRALERADALLVSADARQQVEALWSRLGDRPA